MGKATKRCPNGHFYDADKFASCPFCENVIGGGNGQRVTQPLEQGMQETIPTNEINGMQKTVPGNIENSAKEETAPKEESGGSLSEKFKEDKGDIKKKSNDMQKTVSFFTESVGDQIPAVGLLLCVEGEDFGSTYLLKAGKNFIGRANSMDVVIAGDQSVSREKHAIILYEPKKRMFLAQPGESSELYYVNDEVVLNVIELHEYDEITLGKTKLLFVPICGPQFSWEDYAK